MKLFRYLIVFVFLLIFSLQGYCQKTIYYRSYQYSRDYFGIRFIDKQTGKPYKNQKKYFVNYLKYSELYPDTSIQTLASNGVKYEGLYKVEIIEKDKHNYYIKNNRLKTIMLYTIEMHRADEDTSNPYFVRILSLCPPKKFISKQIIKPGNLYHISFFQVLGNDFEETIGCGLVKHYFYNGVYIHLDKRHYSESPNIIGLNYVEY